MGRFRAQLPWLHGWPLLALAGLLGTLLAADPAASAANSKITIKGEVMTTDMQGFRLSMPTPDWGGGVVGAPAVQQAVASRKTDKDSELLSFIAPGQSADGWTHRYAARALKAPNALGQHVLGTVSDLRQICDPSTMGLQTTKAPTKGEPELTLLLCGRFVDGAVPKALSGKGEVMIVVVTGETDEATKVWEEWRGDAFDISNPATWPVTEKQLTKRGVALQSTVKFEKLH